MGEIKENIIVKLTDREHVLLRPHMYLGSIVPKESREYVLDDSTMKQVEYPVEYIPAIFKMMNEIMDNSIDEFIRTNGKFASKIKFKMSSDQVEIEDTGRGIPQENAQVVLAFTELKAGTNFTEETKDESSLGMNGVGAALVNIFSKEFIVETSNGKSTFTLTCEDNMNKISTKIYKVKSKPYTKVIFKPDLERFKISELSPIYFDLMKTRLFNLAQQFDIEFKLTYNEVELF